MRSDFLATMARRSAERVERARRALPLDALVERARAQEAAPALELSAAGFDLIAEVKFASPSAGVFDESASVEVATRRARRYVEAGAAAISVLTEPTRFAGHLDHLSAVAAAVTVPVMRKDFLVDPYQVWEAREAGAAGVLLIVRILDDARLTSLVTAARESGQFVLLEAFSAADLLRIERFVARAPAAGPPLLVGVNGRDLTTLQIQPRRHVEFAPHLPPALPAVAESGLELPEDAARVADAGYRLALVGSALMRDADPVPRGRAFLDAGRGAREVGA